MGVRLKSIAAGFQSWIGSERGATMVEYALLLALIAVGVLGALQFFGDERVTSWEQIGSALP